MKLPTPYAQGERWTLYHGDCLGLLAMLQEVAAVVTDPPYGIGYQSGQATDRLWRAGRRIRGDRDTAVRDAALELLPPVPTLMFGTWRAPRPATTRQVLVWDKGGALGMGALDIPWKPDHEEIYVIGKGWAGSRDCGSVIRHPPVQSMATNGRIHPNEKPVGLIAMLLPKLPPGPILDCFAGSGAIGEACIRVGRPFIGVEIDGVWCAAAAKRLWAAEQDVAGHFEFAKPATEQLTLGGA